MTTKSEWHAINRALMAEERQRHGQPPTAEEVLAYTRGELPPDEAARVSERLVAYPELVRTLTAEFPSEGAEPGHPDYMPDDELAKHWASLQKRLPDRRGGRVVQFWRACSAIAATLAVVFGTMYWHERAELERPRVAWDQQDLVPDGQRGNEDGSVELNVQGESFLFAVPLPQTPVFDSYRLEILNDSLTPPRSVWRSPEWQRHANEAFPVLVQRSFFSPGRYRIVLYGVSGARQERLTTYKLRVPARPTAAPSSPPVSAAPPH
jgi:hypothetical protein